MCRIDVFHKLFAQVDTEYLPKSSLHQAQKGDEMDKRHGKLVRFKQQHENQQGV